jgi:ferredoxin-NADP reductase
MEAEIAVGRQVWVKLPYGEFIIDGEADVCLIAGGTGITAFTAYLAGLPAGHRQQIDVIYGARTPSLLSYRQVVEDAAARCPGLRRHFLAEENANGSVCDLGRLDLDTIGSRIRDPQSVTYYLSGPPAMLAALQGQLAAGGIETGRIQVDAWE